jgi:hypothetical protein
MLNPTLLSRFNTAADLFSKGNFANALETYQGIFAPEAGVEIESPSESFCLEVRLRTAACLVELGDFVEAKFELNHENTRLLLEFAGPAQRETYFFTFGNVLAKLGDYSGSDLLLARAQEIAVNEIGNPSVVDRICRYRLHWANHYGEWSNLLDLAQECRTYAAANGLLALMHWSTEAICFALRGLHQYAEAKQGAESICTRLQKSGARPEHIAVWTKFITELSA